MAASTEPNKLPKYPGESTINPSFAAPQIQTAPDVRQSQQVAGIPHVPNATATPGASSAISQDTLEPAKPAAQPAQPAPESTNYRNIGAQYPSQAQAPTIPTAAGAPPGVPNTTPIPTPTVPPTAKSLEGQNAANMAKTTAENESAQKLYEAAMVFNGGPSGALEQNTEKAAAGLRQATANRGSAGTINSSLYGEDKGRIANAESVANLKAYQTYQASVNEANQLMERARTAYQAAGEQEKREIAEAAAKRETEQPVYTGGGYTTPNVPNSSNIVVNGPPGAGGVVPRSYKTPGGSVQIGGRKK